MKQQTTNAPPPTRNSFEERLIGRALPHLPRRAEHRRPVFGATAGVKVAGSGEERDRPSSSNPRECQGTQEQGTVAALRDRPRDLPRRAEDGYACLRFAIPSVLAIRHQCHEEFMQLRCRDSRPHFQHGLRLGRGGHEQVRCRFHVNNGVLYFLDYEDIYIMGLSVLVSM